MICIAALLCILVKADPRNILFAEMKHLAAPIELKPQDAVVHQAHAFY